MEKRQHINGDENVKHYNRLILLCKNLIFTCSI